MKKSQNGFVLISVLLITTISTIYAFNEIKGNQLQERIGGNQQKEMNARMLAEKGVFDSVTHIKESLTISMTMAQIKTSLADTVNAITPKGEIEVAPGNYSEEYINLISTGKVNGARALLKAKINIINRTGSSSVPTAIIACESASLTGGGLINSYDSKRPYDAITNAGNGGNVTTISGDVVISGGTDLSGGITASGNISQSGSTEIKGDIKASGNVNLAQAVVDGNIHSGGIVDLVGGSVGSTIDGVVEGGNVTATNGATFSGSQVEGNVHTNGNATFTGGQIGSSTASDPAGNVDVGGNLTIGDDSTISKGSTQYGGTISTPYTDYNESSFATNIANVTPSVAAGAPSIESDVCDPLDVANKMPILTDLTSSSAFSGGNAGVLQTLNFNESRAETYGGGASILPQNIESPLAGGNASSYVFDSLDLTNTMIEISGDVTIVVTGELKTGGAGSGFKFADGDTTSSLKILTEGTVDIGSDSTLFAGSGVNSEGEVPLTLISSNTTEQAVALAGSANSYAKIYAPLGDVTSTASGQLMGAVRGRNVTVSGAGGIHFDKNIGDDVDIFNVGTGTPVYDSIYYYYD